MADDDSNSTGVQRGERRRRWHLLFALGTAPPQTTP